MRVVKQYPTGKLEVFRGEIIKMEQIFVIEDNAAKLSIQSIKEKLDPEKDERILIMSSAQRDRTDAIKKIIEEAASQTSGLILIGAEGENGEVEIADLSQETLVEAINQNSFALCEAIYASAGLIREMPEIETENMTSLALYLAIEAMIAGDEICGYMLPAASKSRPFSPYEITELLRFTVAECNIEDLFPNHAWAEHEEESLSTCYHTLAAIFIKYNDLESASECLNLSEHFEDSPRLLALRGIVASSQGKILEAVANMVSSLQQYEERKRNEGEHYLTFAPTDIDGINEDLKHGLQALNQRDNVKAFEFFSKAIFNFDNFYREIGIEKLGRIH